MPPCPSPEWEVLLEPFRPLFTQPGYRYFCAFVRVLAHLDRRLWVTQVILSGQIDRHFTSFYRFLREGAWSLTAVRHQLWTLCRQHCQGVGGRWFVVVDDTVCPKWGKQFFGLGWHYDPMNRQHPKKLSHGHCFVCLAGLAEQTRDQFVALFVGCALYLQEKACQGGRTFATKLTLAGQLACELALPPGELLLVVADGAYARRLFVQALWAAGRHLVSRLRSDTVFYDLPPVRKKGKKGAPRKYGAKHKAREWADTKQRWREVTLRLYGKDVRLEIKSRVVIQRTLGVRVRLVAVRWEKRSLAFLFSTDTTLTAAEIVRVYCARFSIETGFRDAKQEFGLTTYQVRSERSVERLVHLCLWAQTLLRLRCWEAKPQAIYGEWRKPLGYLTLSQQKQLSQQRCRIVEGSHPGGRTDENATGLPLAA
jgi:DDE superfamily endonuclease